MKKTALPEINAASMADVAFQLLLFFIFATTISNETGLIRKLPPDVPVTETKFKERDVLVVLVNGENKIMVENEEMDLSKLRNTAKRFIENPENDPELPQKVPTDMAYFGKMEITKFHVISLQNDRRTLYKTYITVQNELAAAYNELRNELCMKKFRISYFDLEDEDPRKAAIDKVYPLNISEAEPRRIEM